MEKTVDDFKCTQKDSAIFKAVRMLNIKKHHERLRVDDEYRKLVFQGNNAIGTIAYFLYYYENSNIRN